VFRYFAQPECGDRCRGYRVVSPNQYNWSLLPDTEQTHNNSQTLTVRGQAPPVYNYGSVNTDESAAVNNNDESTAANVSESTPANDCFPSRNVTLSFLDTINH